MMVMMKYEDEMMMKLATVEKESPRAIHHVGDAEIIDPPELSL